MDERFGDTRTPRVEMKVGAGEKFLGDNNSLGGGPAGVEMTRLVHIWSMGSIVGVVLTVMVQPIVLSLAWVSWTAMWKL